MSQKHDSGSSLRSQPLTAFLRKGHGQEHDTDGLAPVAYKVVRLPFHLVCPRLAERLFLFTIFCRFYE